MHSIKLSIFIILLILALLLISCGCEKKATTRILPENQFVQVYCDVVTYADIIHDESRIAFMDSVLKSHQISREELQRSVAYYSKDSKRWEKIFSQVVDELEKREKDFSAQKDTLINIDPDQVPAVPFLDDQE